MRALLERSMSVRVAVALVAAVSILGLVHAADAGDDLGTWRATLIPDQISAAFGFSAPVPSRTAEREPVLVAGPGSTHRHPRRIWAAARGRPLHITLERPPRVAGKPKARVRVAARRPHAPPLPPSLSFDLVPPPARTTLVSIYDDRTLRSGDAVMLGDGVHVFRDDGFWPHRPRDFLRLRSVAGLDWHLRRTLQPFDNNPPTRWTSIMVPPA